MAMAKLENGNTGEQVCSVIIVAATVSHDTCYTSLATKKLY